MRRTPDLIHVGLKRSGSTFLRSYFTQHPEISWARKANYFLRPAAGDLDEYLSLFNGEESEGKVFIDMYEHLSVGQFLKDAAAWRKLRFVPAATVTSDILDIDPVAVAERIKALLPEARILLVLRNQIDWLRTHYRTFLGELTRDRNGFADFLSTAEGQMVAYAGLYDRTLRAYLDLFGTANVHVMLLEELRDSLEPTLRGLCDFCGVGYVPCDTSKVDYNRGVTNYDGNLARLVATFNITASHSGPAASVLKLGRKPVPTRALDRDVLTTEEETLLKAFYAVSNQHTRRLTDRDLGAYGYPL